jgi:hypothetical protein
MRSRHRPEPLERRQKSFKPSAQSPEGANQRGEGLPATYQRPRGIEKLRCINHDAVDDLECDRD